MLQRRRLISSPRYKDNEPCFDLCVKIQDYYNQHSWATRVKVAGLLSANQAIRLAGAQTMTLAPIVIKGLSQWQELETSLAKQSMYTQENGRKREQESVSYMSDEIGWRKAFERYDNGKGAVKTAQVSIMDRSRLGESLIHVSGNRHLL